LRLTRSRYPCGKESPGRVERAIRELFDAHPDEAFITDELVQRFLGSTHMGRCQNLARRLRVTPNRNERFHGIDVLAEHCYPRARPIERKHQVAVLRAAVERAEG
jgi:hypothetical protein